MALHKGLVTLEDQVGLQEFRLGVTLLGGVTVQLGLAPHLRGRHPYF